MIISCKELMLQNRIHLSVYQNNFSLYMCRMRRSILLFLTLFSLFQGGKIMSFEITSSAFKEKAPIPSKYTCDGANISPPLQWAGVPSGTKSLVLIVDD